MTREEKVQELLARYVEAQMVDGVSLDPQELCKDDPELVDTLRARISVFKELDDMLSPPVVEHQVIPCSQCSTENTDDSFYCKHCGTLLENWTPEDSASTLDVPLGRVPRGTVVEGRYRVEELLGEFIRATTLPTLMPHRRNVVPHVREIESFGIQLVPMTAVVLYITTAVSAHWDWNSWSRKSIRLAFGVVQQAVVGGIQPPGDG